MSKKKKVGLVIFILIIGVFIVSGSMISSAVDSIEVTDVYLKEELIHSDDEIAEITRARKLETIEQLLNKIDFSSKDEENQVRNQLEQGLGVEE